jgi:hypothetical protein
VLQADPAGIRARSSSMCPGSARSGMVGSVMPS